VRCASVSQGFRAGPSATAAVNRIGAVSPAARPMLMMMLVMMPGMAAGRITRTMVRQLEAPRLRDASLYVRGTARIASSDARITVGSTSNASVRAPLERSWACRTD